MGVKSSLVSESKLMDAAQRDVTTQGCYTQNVLRLRERYAIHRTTLNTYSSNATNRHSRGVISVEGLFGALVTNAPACSFQMHLRCAQGGGMVDATGDDDDKKRRSIIRHPSHPDHELKLWRRSCSFKCDACSTRREGSSYTCTNDACEYWIHEKCASLPQSFKREDHHHFLSLSFHVPYEYLNFNYKCDVCNTYLLPNYWIYHCQICRFIVHIKCVFNKQPRITENIGKDMIHLPTNEVAEELITPFVMRQRGGETLIPPIIIPAAVDELRKVKYEFLHHQHQLTLVSSGDRSQEEEEEDEENYGVRSELICDACITPISSSSTTSSSNSNSKCYYYYMSCSECKYNLHLACFHLPPQLSSFHSTTTIIITRWTSDLATNFDLGRVKNAVCMRCAAGISHQP
ncbi:uncharacterized protein LOC125207000 [Salvia hispanica]|uniref:uncharacterized protein LOC125207000 n=1 Tax=Salvia hispanica TaxID=49212 RepID=UPI00200971C4|nr:uncharacterized protein LOC125207000 [Salvia hispanica]